MVGRKVQTKDKRVGRKTKMCKNGEGAPDQSRHRVLIGLNLLSRDTNQPIKTRKTDYVLAVWISSNYTTLKKINVN